MESTLTLRHSDARALWQTLNQACVRVPQKDLAKTLGSDRNLVTFRKLVKNMRHPIMDAASEPRCAWHINATDGRAYAYTTSMYMPDKLPKGVPPLNKWYITLRMQPRYWRMIQVVLSWLYWCDDDDILRHCVNVSGLYANLCSEVGDLLTEESSWSWIHVHVKRCTDSVMLDNESLIAVDLGGVDIESEDMNPVFLNLLQEQFLRAYGTERQQYETVFGLMNTHARR